MGWGSAADSDGAGRGVPGVVAFGYV